MGDRALVATGAMLVVLAAGCAATGALGGRPLAGNPAPAYDRDAFGRWLDADGDCQDARNEVLVRDLDDVELSPDGCVVLSGTLVDPYTGEVVRFERGPATSRRVQVDHVLPLREAWRLGASTWSDERRRQFASDLDNLVATSGSVNASKGARLPEEWAPSITTGAVCDYVQTVILVAAEYDLDYDDYDEWNCPTPLT